METKETTQLWFFFVTAKGGNQVLTLDKNKCFDFNLPFLILDHFSKKLWKTAFPSSVRVCFFSLCVSWSIMLVFLEIASFLLQFRWKEVSFAICCETHGLCKWPYFPIVYLKIWDQVVPALGLQCTNTQVLRVSDQCQVQRQLVWHVSEIPILQT